MFKNIKNLIIYDLKYIYYQRIYIYIYILISIFIVINLNSRLSGIDTNLWDLYGVVFMNSMLVIYVPCIISLYFSALIFFDSEINTFVKIRIVNKRQWLISKIISIGIFNIIIITILTIITLVIGSIFRGLSSTWSNAVLLEANRTSVNILTFKYVNFYSPAKLIFINSVTFTIFMTSIGVLGSIISLKFNKPKLGLLMSVNYIIFSLLFRSIPGTKIFKYISYQNFILFGQRNYYDFDKMSNLYLTTREAFIIPLTLLIITVIFGVINIKKVDFLIGEKRLWE